MSFCPNGGCLISAAVWPWVLNSFPTLYCRTLYKETAACSNPQNILKQENKSRELITFSRTRSGKHSKYELRLVQSSLRRWCGNDYRRNRRSFGVAEYFVIRFWLKVKMYWKQLVPIRFNPVQYFHFLTSTKSSVNNPSRSFQKLRWQLVYFVVQKYGTFCDKMKAFQFLIILRKISQQTVMAEMNFGFVTLGPFGTFGEFFRQLSQKIWTNREKLKAHPISAAEKVQTF